MTLNCAIIDDEPLAVELLKSYVEKTSYLKLCGAYNSAVEAMRYLRDNPVDVLFLDIQMPELSGLEFASLLPRQTKIIFTTAFSQYALEGYKVNAIYYLLKPISYEDFEKAAQKALDVFTSHAASFQDADDRFIFIKSDYKLQRVSFDDILYIEGLKDYVRLYLENGEKIMSLMNMKKLEAYLPSPEFMRVHRSYIVHMTKVKTVDRMRMVFGENYIPISESYKDAILEYFEKHTV